MKTKSKVFLSCLILTILLIILSIYKFDPFTPKNELYFGIEINEFCINENCYKVNDEKLNSEIIEATLIKWKTIKIVEKISINKDKFKSFGFDDKKILLKINNKTLEIGNIYSDYTGTLVKKENEEIIYKINVIIDKLNISNPKYWSKNDDGLKQN